MEVGKPNCKVALSREKVHSALPCGSPGCGRGEPSTMVACCDGWLSGWLVDTLDDEFYQTQRGHGRGEGGGSGGG